MSPFWILVTLIVIAVAAFVAGRQRTLGKASGDIRKLHSLPAYYGWNVTLVSFLPALLLLIVWLIAQPMVLKTSVSDMITSVEAGDSGRLSLVLADVSKIANGLDLLVAKGVTAENAVAEYMTHLGDVRTDLGSVGIALGADVTEETFAAANAYRSANHKGSMVMTVAVLALALAAAAIVLLRTTPDTRARNDVERIIRGLLILAASIAILTTIGIVLSLLFNTIAFFQKYPAMDFFFGTTWAPKFQGESELGILPLMWGTMYISIIALAVAVPIGLFAAIYLSEYASTTLRSIAKPALEVLAGIPTIVYGLFALITVGPMLKSAFGEGGALGVTWMGSADAALTAGLVMGIMLIPFMSSLSDDIINSVPQSLRDGSLGLGATKSETIRQVVLPAALPGIVGAFLLAASRAIGETMIVVLGAGAAAQLSLDPFDAMTTVTTRIVAQLTGDNDFSSPTALVAFALGMTLFVVTLILNVLALYIVRKYREQYE